MRLPRFGAGGEIGPSGWPLPPATWQRMGETAGMSRFWDIATLAALLGLAPPAGTAPSPMPPPPTLPKPPFPNQTELAQQCAIGSGASAKGSAAADYKGTGLTPAQVSGAVTVSAKEAACVINRYVDRMLLINAAGDTPQIKDSLEMRWAVRMTMTPEQKGELGSVLNFILKGSKSAPILVYCHHESCGLSFYVAKNIVELGYTNVLWMREGIEGWKRQGYPLSDDPDKWRAPLLAASKRVLDCYNAQPVAGLEPVESVKARIRNSCSSQQAALRASFGGWYPPSLIDASLKSVATQFDGSLTATINSKQAEPRRLEAERKKKEEDAQRELAWKRKQGIGVPASDLRSGFEFCRFQIIPKTGKNILFLSNIYPAQVGREAFDNLKDYDMSMAVGVLTEKAISFVGVLGVKKADIQSYYNPICQFRPTLGEAQEARNAAIRNASLAEVRNVGGEAWPPKPAAGGK